MGVHHRAGLGDLGGVGVKTKWIHDIPRRTWDKWFGEWLLSSMVLKAWHKKHGQPDELGNIKIKGTKITFDARWRDER